MMLAEEVPEARDAYALAGAKAMALLRPAGDRRNLLTANRASAERIQDHSCAILSSR